MPKNKKSKKPLLLSFIIMILGLLSAAMLFFPVVTCDTTSALGVTLKTASIIDKNITTDILGHQLAFGYTYEIATKETELFSANLSIIIGYLLPIIGAALCLSGCILKVNKKMTVFLTTICLILMIVGGIIIFLTPTLTNIASSTKTIAELGGKLATGAYIAGASSILGALLSVIVLLK